MFSSGGVSDSRGGCRQAMRRHQVEVEVIPEDDSGDIDIPALESLIQRGPSRPVLIAITHVPTSSGNGHRAAGPILAGVF